MNHDYLFMTRIWSIVNYSKNFKFFFRFQYFKRLNSQWSSNLLKLSKLTYIIITIHSEM